MIRRLNGRHARRAVCALVAAFALAAPAVAQSTGMVKGLVRDDKGQPIDGAKITIEFVEGVNRKQETKTNKKGEFVQIGLQSGAYKITAEKEGIGSQQFDARVRIGQATEVNFVLSGKNAPPSKEDLAKGAELSTTCADCYYNIGYAYSQKKEYDKAEAAYKKAIEIKADYGEAYNGLANIYNAQRKFDEAAAASTKAAELGGSAAAAGGGGNVNAMYNQGVILWNAGKIPEAKKQFEAVLKADPNHAESHYQLGMALVNEGNLAAAATEFETYLKLAPDGPNSATAKALVAQLKK